MTRYKKYMKNKFDIQFNEDFDMIPYPVANVSIEDRDVFATPRGLLVVTTYNVDITRWFVTPDGLTMSVYDEDDEIEIVNELAQNRCLEIRIYFDFPYYRFYFDEDDKLVAIRYMNNDYYLG